MDPTNYDDVLLYWSGELDAREAEAVEARLRDEAGAQSYLEELQKLSEEVGSLPPAEVPRAFAAEAAAAAVVPGTVRVVRFWPGWIAAAAAVLILVGVVVRSGVGDRGGRGAVVAEGAGANPGETAPRASKRKPPKLSERLFVSRSRQPAGDKLSAARERVRKLRNRLNTKNTS